jgi:2-polyprenyl-3-methyl-5-hydroxy-6-metoxy-1,4-benzoquinol methylase
MAQAPKYDEFHFALNAIFQLVGSGKKVLDVGCATGRLSEKLRNEKDCFVVGIESDEVAARLAQHRCDRVIVANVELLEEIPFPPGYFDTLVFADVLEHLKDPEMFLKRFKRYLSEGGCVIISVPNIANWFIRLKLLLGRWDYRETGILDKTHIRFFI